MAEIGMTESMDDLEERARAHLDRLRTVQEQLAAISEEVTSPGGEVTVVVDGVGSLIALQLDNSIARMLPRQFETLIVATCAVAAQRALARRARVAEDFDQIFSIAGTDR